MFTDEEIFLVYGREAIISRKGRYTLVHLDRPLAETVCQRTEDFDPDEFFHPDCALCGVAREEGLVVYDDPDAYMDDEILME